MGMTTNEAIEILRKNRPTSDPRPCGMELCDAVDMAISALRQQDVTDKDVGKWISVKDRLPDYMGEVLVIVSGKPHENITLDGAYEIAEYDPVEGWILEMWPEWCSGVVTHWMPLPEPPEEDEAKLFVKSERVSER